MRRPKYAPSARHKLPALLAMAHAGRLGFDELVRETSAEWTRLASYVFAMWRLPDAVELQDVAQEMMLAAWRALRAWDPSRGIALHTHVVWNAVARGKRFAQEQRNSPRRCGAAPARYELSASALGASTFDALVTGDRSPVRMSDERVELDGENVALGLARLRHHEGDMVIATLLRCGCDLDGTARTLYDGGLARNEAGARRMVRRALRKVEDGTERAT